jgi:2-polyprenyl-3-methyl-5-hydroxy-6-metoxy-1,4-benzoquinol methylase
LIVLDFAEINSEVPDIAELLPAKDECSFVFAENTSIRHRLATLIGPHYSTFKISQNLAVGLLSSGFPIVRIYALSHLRKVSLLRFGKQFSPVSFALYAASAGIPISAQISKGIYKNRSRPGLLPLLWRIFKLKLQRWNKLYSRELDPDFGNLRYSTKLGYASSHTLALEAVKRGAKVADFGSGPGQIANELATRAKSVIALDLEAPTASLRDNIFFIQRDLEDLSEPLDLTGCGQIFLLDIVEHMRDPEKFLEWMHQEMPHQDCEIILTTPNIGFFVQRVMLLFGHFNYGRKGILDRTHCRLFTFSTLEQALQQSGFDVLEIKGIPAPYPEALGNNKIAHLLLSLNSFAIKIWRNLFSFQIYIRAVPHPIASDVKWEVKAL